MIDPDEKNVIETEQRQARVILFTTILGVIALIGGQVVQASGLDGDADGDAETLVDQSDHFGTLMAGSIINGLGYILLSGTIVFLFMAAARRTDRMQNALKPIAVIGGVLLLISAILATIGVDSIAKDFLDGTPITGDGADDRASDLASDSVPLQIAQTTIYVGYATFGIGMIYSGLWAMRTGLLTRFWATLGMAFGGAIILIFIVGPIGIFGMMVWMVHIALVSQGRWMGDPLPAWEQGKAVPWPDPNAPAPEPEPEEAADPEDFEGSATEVASERPGRRDNKRKRKRKQRG